MKKIVEAMVRSLSKLSIYAGNAAFFLLLSIFPAATLLLGLLTWLPVGQSDLLAVFSRILPEAAVSVFQYVFEINNAAAVVSVSAVAAVWSASRGTYGVLRGLNFAYGLKERRGYLRLRLHCMLDTLLLFLAILAALLLYVYSRSITAFFASGFLRFLVNPVFRFLLTAAVLTLIFSVVYLAFPSHRVHFRDVLPGAAFSGLGWMLFSLLYSWYVTSFPGMNRFYGGLSAVAVTMLWLYFCMEILFLGGVLNRTLHP